MEWAKFDKSIKIKDFSPEDGGGGFVVSMTNKTFLRLVDKLTIIVIRQPFLFPKSKDPFIVF